MSPRHVLNKASQLVLLTAAFCGAIATSALEIPAYPLSVNINGVKPMVMLVAGRDHRLFYEAYNDASDVDGDGTMDIRFKPGITYVGLFQSDLCYTHNGNSNNNGLFTPSGRAGTANTCPGKWSGNWLNYVTTSRIDALRVVLYGGHREKDSATETVLRRAYIPQDAHSWAKEYQSQAIDGYKISDYTPLAQPSSGKRHFFGNVTGSTDSTPMYQKNCSTLDSCSNLPPWLSVVTNSSKRVWEWASTERPVLADNTHGGSRTNYTVRVSVCTKDHNDGCKQYPKGNWKPVGLLHDYGETDTMLFGLMTGSYDKNQSGGRLRKVISSFKDEIKADDGTFTANATIVTTFDKLRIRGFNNGRTDGTYASWGPWLADRAPNSGEFPDWGNPMGEMMYEAVRYFAGKKTPTSAYATPTTVDAQVGLSNASWDDPYASNSAAKAPTCARGNLLTISDINVSYDSDELPGSRFNTFSGDLAGLNVGTVAKFITDNEPDARGPRFIGQSTSTNFDSAPTAKQVDDLGLARGLAPEEPTKNGSYYAASVAYYAKTTDLRSDKEGKQTLDTFTVALASPLPRIEAKLSGGKIVTLVPFAKTVAYNHREAVNRNKGQFQPTDQIVDFYVTSIANSSDEDRDTSVNGGRYSAKFQINFEDVEQGADHDMDAVVEYTVEATADNKLSVRTRVAYNAEGWDQRLGYVISGTTKDGIYLEVQNREDKVNNADKGYFLNTPPGKDPGHCNAYNDNNTAGTGNPSECRKLPFDTTRTFSPSSSTAGAARLLESPLWYAAKWGGFVDKDNNNKPNLDAEFDVNGDGIPDTYLLVQNPLKLKESLRKSLDNIANRSSSASNISANSTSISSNARLYQAVFNTQRWSGDLISYPTLATGGVGATPDWEASQRLPAWNQRNIFMRTASSTTVKLSTYAALPTADQTALVSQDIFDYLRGNRSKELLNGGSLRDREHALGDIVHSSPFYDKEAGVVYVGANDGMLHAFNGKGRADGGGTELFAFIPRASVARLPNLARQSYGTSADPHQWYVDGDVNVMTITPASGAKKNYLFALMGRGGKGLFALDVTNPAAFTTSNYLWEYTPEAAMSVGTLKSNTDPDLGYMLGRSVAVPLNNGKMGLLVGNGYNSIDQKAVLYIFIINANGSIDAIRKIDTGVDGDNGLAAPVTADTNNDGTADVAYAGDLKGNVWKFDLSGSDPGTWKVANGTPMFVATDASNNRQPITAPMYTAVNDRGDDPNFGKRFVFFGTGSYFKQGDGTDAQKQSWYGIIDTGSTVSKGDLTARTITSGTLGGTPVRTFSQATTDDMKNKKGWRIELPLSSPPVATGERIVSSARLVPFVIPALMTTSLYPNTTDICVPGGNGYLNVVDPWSGASLSMSVLDVNNSGGFEDDKLNNLPVGSMDLAIGIPTEPLFLTGPGKVDVYVGGSGTTSTSGALIKYIAGLGKSGTTLRGRISWREIVRD